MICHVRNDNITWNEVHYGILSDRRPGKTENKFAAENEADAMAAENCYDYIFKVLFLGDSGSGKTSIVFRLASFETNNEIISTIGVDVRVKAIELQGKKIKLQLWDTAGQERFHSMTTLYYRGAMGIMLVYDITKEKTFEDISNWLRDIEEHADEDVEKMILGSRCHKEDERIVSKENGEQLAKEHDAQFFEVSAEENINIKEALYNLAEKMLEKKLSTNNEETSQNIRVSDAEEKKGGCC